VTTLILMLVHRQSFFHNVCLRIPPSAEANDQNPGVQCATASGGTFSRRLTWWFPLVDTACFQRFFLAVSPAAMVNISLLQIQLKRPRQSSCCLSTKLQTQNRVINIVTRCLSAMAVGISSLRARFLHPVAIPECFVVDSAVPGEELYGTIHDSAGVTC